MIFHNKKLNLNYYNVEEMPRILDKLIEHNGITWCGRKIKYLDWSISFDIESTSFRDYLKKLALMWIWMLGLQDDQTGFIYTIVGRTWKEWQEAIKCLYELCPGDNHYIPIYVHNLSFEYFFIKPYVMEKDVFVVKSNDLLYMRTWEGLEFRCSMKVAGCKLADITQFLPTDCKVKKLVGDLDYKLMRHRLSNVTDDEMAYCLNDVRLVCEYISQKRREDGDISKIQRTATGYGRKGIMDFVFNDMTKKEKAKFIAQVMGTCFHNGLEMKTACRAFMGGHTAGNPQNRGRILRGVTCWDFTSSYPSICVCCSDFPIEYIGYMDNMTEPEYRVELSLKHAIIGKAIFKGLRPRVYEEGRSKETVDFDYYIPSSKCVELEGEVKYNGKVASADLCSIYIIDLDFTTYELFYEWDSVEFEGCFLYKKGYLPKKVIEYVLSLYQSKTTLKGVKGQELKYAKDKALLNAVSYGMNVTSPEKDILQYDSSEDEWKPTIDGEWKSDLYDMQNADDVAEYWDLKVNAYNDRIRAGQVTVSYIQGIYISGAARANLALGIMSAGLKHLFAYSDTDSIYIQHSEELDDFITSYNNMIKQKMERMCKFYDLQQDCWRPKTIKGEEKPLGYWDFDGYSEYFKQVRAKTYAKIDKEGHFKITIAGLNKQAGAAYIAQQADPEAEIIRREDGTIKDVIVHNPEKVLNYIDIGMHIPEGETGKLLHTISRSEYKGTITDYEGVECDYDIQGGVNLSDTSFDIKDCDSDFEKFLSFISNTVYDER